MDIIVIEDPHVQCERVSGADEKLENVFST